MANGDLMLSIESTVTHPGADDTMDLGELALQYKNLYLDGLAYIDGFGEDTDLGDFDIHSLDGLYGVDDGVFIDLGADGRIILQADGSGTPFSTPDIDITGTTYFDDDAGFLLDKKILFGDADVFIYSNDDGYLDLVADTGVRTNNYIRHTSSNYRRYYHLSSASFAPGLSGATWTPAGANNLAGWQLDSATELLESGVDIHADWDAASDLVVEVYFALLSTGNPDDTVDIKMVVTYMGLGETAPKTQTVEVATTTDGTQYKVYKALFTINYDETSNVVQVGDIITMTFNLETDTSEIDNILFLHASFYYNTTHLGVESGDV